MCTPVSAAEWKAYRAAAARRAEKAERRREIRRQRALAVAREAASILTNEFGAARVRVFGSVLSAERFHGRSDVDLAVWGVSEAAYLRAVARLLALDPSIPVDLVEADRVPEPLHKIIEATGEDLGYTGT